MTPDGLLARRQYPRLGQRLAVPFGRSDQRRHRLSTVPYSLLVGVTMRDRAEDAPFPFGDCHQVGLVLIRPLDEHRVAQLLTHGCSLHRTSWRVPRLLPFALHPSPF